MLKFIVVLHRKKGLTPEQFRTYFIEVHQLLAQKILGLRRYKQNFVLPDPKRKRPEWDCVVELYFDNQEAMEAAWASPEGQAATADLDVFRRFVPHRLVGSGGEDRGAVEEWRSVRAIKARIDRRSHTGPFVRPPTTKQTETLVLGHSEQ
jgi:uncharacterized protein (TIGR02118 family)